MLFVSSEKSSDTTAYNHRIFNLEKHCREEGAKTEHIYLGDMFFHSPVFIQVLNTPFILKKLANFDVIHAGGNGAAYFFAIAKPFIGRKTIVVYDVHSDAITESHLMMKNRFDLAGFFAKFQMTFMEIIATQRINYFAASSHEIKKRLIKRANQIESDNIEVIINGVDLREFKPQENSSSINSHFFTVTYAGSFGPIEAVDNLIRAAEILKDENICFKLIGFRKTDQRMKNEIKTKLGNRALLIDWLPRNDLIAELQKSDVLVIPADASNYLQSQNRSAVYVTKFAEFLATGKPVIITRIDLPSMIIENFDCGFVCEPTADSIAETIRKAKNCPADLLSMKGRNGRQFAERELDQKLICKKYLEFLNAISKKD